VKSRVPEDDKLVCPECLFETSVSKAHLFEDSHPHKQSGYPIKNCARKLFLVNRSEYRIALETEKNLKARQAEVRRPFNREIRTIEQDILLVKDKFANYHVIIDPEVSAAIFSQMQEKVPEIERRRDDVVGALKNQLRDCEEFLEIMKPRMDTLFERERFWKDWRTKNYLLIDNAHVNYERITTVTPDDVSQKYFCDRCRRLVGLVEEPPYFVAPHQDCPNSSKQLTLVDLKTVSAANQKYPGNPDLKRPFDLPRDGHPG